LPRAEAGEVIAEGGAGKTMAMLQLAVAIATGDDWLGAFRVDAPGRVFLLLAEEDGAEARRRIYAGTRTGRTPQADKIVLLPLKGVPCAFLERDAREGSRPTEFLQQLRDHLAATGPWDLIVLEPLSRLGGPDVETDNAVATMFVQAVESIVAATDATVLVAHHTGKTARGGGPLSASSGRGSTALHDGFRWVATLAVDKAKGDDVVTLAFGKANYSREAEPLMLRRGDGGALTPIDAAELEQVKGELDGSAARSEKAAQREAELAQSRERKAKQTTAARAALERQRAEGATEQRAAEERVLVKLLREKPGITASDLRATLAARLDGCTRDRMRDIVARLGAAVVVTTPEGAKHGTLAHTLVESLLPEMLR
jgi:RecA-family ATPase